jgi:DNA-binding SARP family transcriptional activator
MEVALHLRTLGAWHLVAASGERLLEPGKPLALLTYLALTPRHRAGREHLIDLLWAESDPTRARQALRQTIWNLRQVVGTDGLTSEGDDLLLAAAIGSDHHTFLRHVERGEIEPAVAVYAGPFLPDFAAPGGAAFEQWADVERSRLHAVYLRVLETLVRSELAAGRVRQADALARRLRDADPDRESVWRLLLEVRLSAGDLSGAALEADALEARLRAEGRDPEQATRALMARARSRPDTEQGDQRLLHPELVGREQEFATLLAAWRAAARKPGRHLHVSSAPGIGKTRLLQELGIRLAAVGGRVCAVRANPGERDVAFALAADLAVALAALPGAAAVSPGSAASLVALDPALSARYPAARPSSSGADDAVRERGRALAELVGTVADEQPLAVLVDDLHWADAASVRVLGAVLHRLQSAPALVVTASRPGGAAPPTVADTAVLHLSSLTPGQVLDLLASLGTWQEGPWPRELADALARTAGGSPLLVLETLQLALDHGDLAVAARRWQACDLPVLIRGLEARSAVRRRLDRLVPEEREVATLLAVAGAPPRG